MRPDNATTMSTGRPLDEGTSTEKPAAREWNTDPLYVPPAGPDNVADGFVAAINTVMAGARAARRRFSALRSRRP